MNPAPRRAAHAALASLALIASCLGEPENAKQPIGIEDLVTYTRIRNVHVSPNGKWASYLTLDPLLQANSFDCKVWLHETRPGSTPVELARFQANAEQVYVETGELKDFGGQSAWSPNSRQLAYTMRTEGKMSLLVRELTGRDVLIAGGFLEAKLTGWNEAGTQILFSRREQEEPSSERADPSVLVTDEQQFGSSSWARRPEPPRKSRAFQYEIASSRLTEVDDEDQRPKHELLPATYEDAKWLTPPDTTKRIQRPVVSPSTRHAVFTGSGNYDKRDARKASRDYFVGIKSLGDDSQPREFLHSSSVVSYFQWKRDGKEVDGLRFDPEHTAVIGRVRYECVRSVERVRDLAVVDRRPACGKQVDRLFCHASEQHGLPSTQQPAHREQYDQHPDHADP